MVPEILKEGSFIIKRAFIKTFWDIYQSNRMGRDEAIKILSLEPGFSKEELQKNYSKFYKTNSLENKGSPYIQSRIKDAYDVLKIEKC